jgi:hypothetical protein
MSHFAMDGSGSGEEVGKRERIAERGLPEPPKIRGQAKSFLSLLNCDTITTLFVIHEETR